MATETPSKVERAERLLREVFAAAGEESVGRHNELLRLGAPGHLALLERRRWAEAWQLLERAGLICREPDETSNRWFLTGQGRQALSGGDIAGAIMLAGVKT
jgi:hypothetical protein